MTHDLTALADEYLGMAKAHRLMGDSVEASNCELIVTALRAAAVQGKSVAYRWRMSHLEPWKYCSSDYVLSPDVRADALYLSPPPAAGWDDAIEAAKKVVEPWRHSPSYNFRYVADAIYSSVEALRHNAPPDSGAGKSAPVFKASHNSGERDPSVMPDWTGAGAGESASNAWRSISKDTSWVDGRDVVLLANDMEVQARYCPGEWSDETPSSPREYSGAVWSCFDDQFQLEIEECSKDPSEWGHDGATHWRPTSELPPTPLPDHGGADAGVGEGWTGRKCAHCKGTGENLDAYVVDDFTRCNHCGGTGDEYAALVKPAPVAANASAEARLREALQRITGFIRDFALYDQKHALESVLMISDEALSAHPRTSDCDKQKECCDLAAKEPCSDCPFPNPDAAMRGLTDLERTLLIASKAALNYITNTESELGMTLKSGDLLRAAIAKAEACEISAHPHASDCDKQEGR